MNDITEAEWTDLWATEFGRRLTAGEISAIDEVVDSLRPSPTNHEIKSAIMQITESRSHPFCPTCRRDYAPSASILRRVIKAQRNRAAAEPRSEKTERPKPTPMTEAERAQYIDQCRVLGVTPIDDSSTQRRMDLRSITRSIATAKTMKPEQEHAS